MIIERKYLKTIKAELYEHGDFEKIEQFSRKELKQPVTARTIRTVFKCKEPVIRANEVTIEAIRKFYEKKQFESKNLTKSLIIEDND
jgi:hypothetical protein